LNVNIVDSSGTQGSYGPWKVLEKGIRSLKTLENSWNSKVVVLDILLSGSSRPIAH